MDIIFISCGSCFIIYREPSFLFKPEEPVRKVINNLRNNGFSEDGLKKENVQQILPAIDYGKLSVPDRSDACP